ncbi:MAG: hypothetical protein F7B17_06205 [Desulfurococcales archaeon]|nr:hypothetical protein [Desulfurococcales archaeon]
MSGSTKNLCIETPHHITALFRPVLGPTAATSGSIGAGIAVEPPARLCLGRGPPEGGSIGYEPPPHLSEASRRTGARLESARYVFPLPPGRGYAVSAAASILGAMAAAALKGIPVNKALRTAHEIEVEKRTGLGDVAAITCGIGVVFRLTPGPPGEARVECVPLDPRLVVIVGEAGAMTTRELIAAYGPGEWLEASRSMERIVRDPSPHRFFEEAMKFTEARRLDEKMLGVKLKDILPKEGIVAFYVKKRLAVVVAEEDTVRVIVDALETAGLQPRILFPSKSPPRYTS